MKKVLLSLLAVLLVMGVLGATGYAGYRYGYQQGALTTSDGTNQQFVHPGFGMGPNRTPMDQFGFNGGFDRGFGIRERGVGFFSPFMFLARIAFWALILWAIYMLVTRSGWRLTRTTPVVESPAATSNTQDVESAPKKD